jgi:hypothetical protein
VAYRQLCSVTFAVLGLVAFGCGGNTTASTATGSTPAGEQPPGNPDQAPSGADQAPTSSDTPAANTDGPPASSETPAGSGAGGKLGALCQQLCSSIDQAVNQCSQGKLKLGMDDLCSSSCDIPPTVLPCESELASLLQCFIGNLGSLCVASGDNNGQDPVPAAQPTVNQCDAAATAAQACAKANHIDTSDMGMNMDPNPPGGPGPVADCTTGAACTQCICNAGADATKVQACATACATP